MEFFMPMLPPTVTHQDKEIRAWVKDGRARAVLHDSDRLKDARAKLRAHLCSHRPAAPIPRGTPVRLVVKWLFPGQGHSQGQYHTTKPDTDNLQKALKGVMTELGFCNDDAQVASEIVEKFWADPAGIYVSVEELQER